MKTLTSLAFIILTVSAFAQGGSKYKIEYDGRHYLVQYAIKTPIILPAERCYEVMDPLLYSIRSTRNFIIVRVHDDQDNDQGVLLFDRAGKQINLDKVTAIRKKYYKHADCCAYVDEFNGQLIFWEGTYNHNKEDYNCANDSQSDGYDNVPRYYIFNPKTNSVEIKILEKPCPQLFQGGKIVCQ